MRRIGMAALLCLVFIGGCAAPAAGDTTRAETTSVRTEPRPAAAEALRAELEAQGVEWCEEWRDWNAWYDGLTEVERFYTDAAVRCEQGGKVLEGVGSLELDFSVPFVMTAETEAGTLHMECAEEGGQVELRLGGETITPYFDHAWKAAFVKADGREEYLFIYDEGPSADPCVWVYRLNGRLAQLGQAPDYGIRTDGAGLLVSYRFTQFDEAPVVFWHQIAQDELRQVNTDPALWVGQSFTPREDLEVWLYDTPDHANWTPETIPAGEAFVLRGFWGWYNCMSVTRTDGTVQHIALWIGD